MSGEAPRRLWVVTDLDGSLLDGVHYRWDAARDALDALAAAGIPLILASGKTRAEIEAIAVGLPSRPACIVENGGALVVPPAFAAAGGARRDGPPLVVELGVPRAVLLRALADIAAETGVRTRSFADLTVAETASLTGLSEPMARLARDRHYDEPFLLDPPEALPAVVAAASRRGLRITHGGRWHHVTGATDKGRALTLLLARCGGSDAPATVGLGDAANDVSFLGVVDRPILIPGRHGIDPSLAAALPAAECAPAPGPAGWNAAILAVLAGRRLAPVPPG